LVYERAILLIGLRPPFPNEPDSRFAAAETVTPRRLGTSGRSANADDDFPLARTLPPKTHKGDFFAATIAIPT
jgi:hypothetical protein